MSVMDWENFTNNWSLAGLRLYFFSVLMLLMGLNYLLFILTLFLREIYFLQLRWKVYLNSIGKVSKINRNKKIEKLKFLLSLLICILCEKVVGWASAWQSYKTQHQTSLFLSEFLLSRCWPGRVGCGWKNLSQLRKNLPQLRWTIL